MQIDERNKIPKLTYYDIMEGLEINDQVVKAPMWANEVWLQGGEPTCAIDFYEDIFKEGYLEPSREREEYVQGEYGGIVIKARRTTDEERRRLGRKTIGERYTITDGNSELIDVIKEGGNDFIFLSPASYAGRQRSNANARFLYAVVFEIDNIKPAKGNKADGVEQLFYSFERENRQVPRPTYVVCSGSGLHLYYVLEKPVPLFPNVIQSINNWRREIIPRAWDGVSSDEKKDIQFEHVLQGFRAVGARTKGQTFALAFKTGDEWLIEDLNTYVSKKNQINLIYQSKTRLEDAKELYPEWYERRIENGEKQGHYSRSEGIYHNWISKMYEQASVGHRYYCLLELVALATQCDISYEQVEEDAYKLAQYLDTLTTDSEKNPFTAYDVECALNMYGTIDAYLRRVDYVEQATGISCPTAKRNGRKRDQHVKLMSAIRDIDYADGSWRENGGAKPKWELVQEWRFNNPKGTKAQCIKETGLSKPTVYKWWGVTKDPDAAGSEAERKVREWQDHNPTGSKDACHKETGISRHYINKAWRQGMGLHEDKLPFHLEKPAQLSEWLEKAGHDPASTTLTIEIKSTKSGKSKTWEVPASKLLDDSELIK